MVFKTLLTNAKITNGIDFRKSILQDTWLLIQEKCHGNPNYKKCVALSKIETVYIAIIEASKELKMNKFLKELSQKLEKYTLNCDSQSAIYLNKNSTFYLKFKHINVMYH